MVSVSLYAWFVADLRSQGVLVSPPSIPMGCGQRTMAETMGSLRNICHLWKPRGDHVAHAQRPGVHQVPVLPPELSCSVLCPGLESRHTANGIAPHGDPVSFPGLPAQDQVVNFSISRSHQGRTTNPCHSTVLPHHDRPLHFTWDFLRRNREDCWW